MARQQNYRKALPGGLKPIVGASGVGRFTPPRQTQRPRPPAFAAAGTKRAFVSGPGDPPAWFMDTGIVSLSEWYIYWAFLRVKGPPGETSWANQISAGGGRSTKGGAVIDFVVWDQDPRLAIRIQTERFHIAAPMKWQANDELQKRMLERMGWKVIDIFEEHFIKDKSGKAAIAIVRLAINGIEKASPLTLPNSRARPAAIRPRV